MSKSKNMYSSRNIKKCCPTVEVPVLDPPSRFKTTFPKDIKALLILLAEDEGDNDIDIALKSSCEDHCFIRNADPVAVFDNTLVIRESNGGCGKFTYIDICCICTVSFRCEALLDELFEAHNISGE